MHAHIRTVHVTSNTHTYIAGDGRLAARRARSRTRRCDKRFSSPQLFQRRARSLASFRSRASVLSEARERAVAAVLSQASADGVASVGCTFGVGHSESIDVASKRGPKAVVVSGHQGRMRCAERMRMRIFRM